LERKPAGNNNSLFKMNQHQDFIFINLFKEVCQKCFGHELTSPLTESESKHMASEMLESTGLVIGWKSLKNYSIFALNEENERNENPSVATLDTLARYLAAAPQTNESSRKKTGAHFPYWFNYRDNYIRPAANAAFTYKKLVSPKPWVITVLALILLVPALLLIINNQKSVTPRNIQENFKGASKENLKKNGWVIKNMESNFWEKQKDDTGHFKLFTIKGDNFPDTTGHTGIQNLLLRELNLDCFTAEVQFANFIPYKNWQQAGLLLMEDSNYTGKSIRISVGFNDFFGGDTRPGEIIIQVIATSEGNIIKPEELAQSPIFSFSQKPDTLIKGNMQKSGLRIEKKDNHFRFLFANGNKDIFAFKEIVSKEINIHPRYIAIYASSGSNTGATIIPVAIENFIIKSDCNQ
jgi:hypothetical protein